MPGDLMSAQLEEARCGAAVELAGTIAEADFTRCTATVVGAGRMGAHYVDALRALRVRRIRLVARTAARLDAFRGLEGVETVAGGVERLAGRPEPDELGIVATPIPALVAATDRLVSLGFRRVLIEKPVSLWAEEIEGLAAALERHGAQGFCAYNRVAYPSLQEVRARAGEDGGMTSCTYALTERIKPDWPARIPAATLARWGLANSVHVMSLAHGLIGWPATWSSHRSGALPWHPTGAVFVGSGVSERGIPFAYHADWGSSGRWGVEVHTAAASYRLCPLEKVFRRTSASGDWTELPVAAFAPQLKAGLVEQVAAALDPAIRVLVPLVSLASAAALTRFGEAVFGYDTRRVRTP